MKHKRIDGPKPLPRLQHIEPGQDFILLATGEKYKMRKKDKMYCYVENGRIGLSSEIDSKDMVFGVNGWRKIK